jgi:hypothetical protein
MTSSHFFLSVLCLFDTSIIRTKEMNNNIQLKIETIHTFAKGTFKSTRTNTFFPSRSTFLARPSTFNFSKHVVDAWNDRRKAVAEPLKNLVLTEERSILIFLLFVCLILKQWWEYDTVVCETNNEWIENNSKSTGRAVLWILEMLQPASYYSSTLQKAIQ